MIISFDVHEVSKKLCPLIFHSKINGNDHGTLELSSDKKTVANNNIVTGWYFDKVTHVSDTKNKCRVLFRNGLITSVIAYLDDRAEYYSVYHATNYFVTTYESKYKVRWFAGVSLTVNRCGDYNEYKSEYVIMRGDEDITEEINDLVDVRNMNEDMNMNLKLMYGITINV